MRSTSGDRSPRPLFAALLGDAFATLPATVRGLHAARGGRWRGEATVERGHGLGSRFCAALTRLPPAGAHPVVVEIEADGVEDEGIEAEGIEAEGIEAEGAPTGARGERWTRRYGTSHAMPSRLWSRDGLLCERLGPVVFRFRIAVDRGAIVWNVAAVRVAGLSLPGRWFAGVVAREFEHAGRYRFDVAARLPVIGLLVHYRGWLEPA